MFIASFIELVVDEKYAVPVRNRCQSSPAGRVWNLNPLGNQSTQLYKKLSENYQ